MNVVVIGKNSFLANQLKQLEGCQKWVFVTHQEIKSKPSCLLNADVVINFAIEPSVFTKNFSEAVSFEIWLVKQIQHYHSVHYIMISTRQVYGDFHYLEESLKPKPISIYGNNKLKIEDRILELINPSRITILRCSNIFGFEIGRNTFFGSMLTSLIKNKEITFNISPKTVKDFIAVEDFAEVIFQIVRLRPAGLFNLGSGVDSRCGDLALEILEGFSEGRLISNNNRIEGQFFMDISKIKSLINYPNITDNSLKFSARNLGLKLKDFYHNDEKC